jgi:glucoamylase
VRRGFTLRIQAPAAFRLRWTRDEWQTVSDTASTPTEVGIEFVDLAIAPHQKAPIQFTFYWPQANRWEGRDFDVRVV